MRANANGDLTAPGFRSLLAPVDLTPASDRVLGRVARLPLAEGATVTLLHVVSGGMLVHEQRAAAHDAARALEEEARGLADALPGAARVRVKVSVGGAAREIVGAAREEGADLIVMGRGGGRALRDAFLGATAERVMRAGRLPVLAVRRPPRARYRRPALAVDLDAQAPGAFAALLRLLPPPRPPIEVIHAFDSPYEGLAYPSVSRGAIAEHRAELRRGASARLHAMLAETLARAGLRAGDATWRLHVRYGAPRTLVTKVVRDGHVELLALGSHGHAGLAHAFLGSVAGDLLREVGCDVLVVPAAAGDGAG